MTESDNLLSRKGDPLQLLEPDILKRNQAIQELELKFKNKIPERFSPPRVIASPLERSEHVLRSDCTQKGCGVRVTTYFKKNEQGQWNFKYVDESGEVQPFYSREQNSPCVECQKLFESFKQT